MLQKFLIFYKGKEGHVNGMVQLRKTGLTIEYYHANIASQEYEGLVAVGVARK